MDFREYVQSRYVKGLDTKPKNEKVKEVLTALIRPTETRRAHDLVNDASDLKLHLGAGDTYLDGWVNIDLARPGRKLDLRWDLRRPLPFPQQVASAIFTEHFFEHLYLHHAIAVLDECYRVMKPNGIIRIGVPDYGRYISSYIGQDSMIATFRPEAPTPMLALNEVSYFYGHRSMYDAETMILLLESVGFRDAVRTPFGQSEIDRVPDSGNREIESLYVEARR